MGGHHDHRWWARCFHPLDVFEQIDAVLFVGSPTIRLRGDLQIEQDVIEVHALQKLLGVLLIGGHLEFMAQ